MIPAKIEFSEGNHVEDKKIIGRMIFILFTGKHLITYVRWFRNYKPLGINGF